MIKLLSITNLAVISRLRVEFGTGLNILSGETGAGKSIILAALGLLLGERASQDMLRTGETKAVVEGVFEIEGNSPLSQLLDESGIEDEGTDLIIKREIIANGRGKVFVNNQAATLNLLKAIQPHIIDVHGQGEQQSLLSTNVQTSMLDAYAGCGDLRQTVEELYEQVSQIAKQLEESKRSESERLQMLDLLEYQIKEIEGISPLAHEDEELETERRILVNAEKLSSLCEEINQLLYDDDGAALSKLALAGKRIDELAEIDPQFQVQSEQIASVKYILEDVAFAARDFANKVIYSPERLQWVTDRLTALDRLKRKYGEVLGEVINHLNVLRVKYCELKNSDDHEAALVTDLQAAVRNYERAASKLTTTRKNAAKELEGKLKKDLSAVALEKSQFIVCFNRPGSGNGFAQLQQQFGLDFQETIFSKLGKEIAEFYFSANKGEEARALSAVASGGELSRLMLILKTNIAPTPYPRTLVFDEVDTGIGGRVADAVGVRLKRLSHSNQVICVTHQAQIARYADTHLQVAKEIKGQRTVTNVTRLEAKERVEELARMMAGAGVTTVTREHAKEMLDRQSN
jgi:DNA repair protein RecN (Recombination protein N)